MISKKNIAILLGSIFVVGTGIIIYLGRPAMKLNSQKPVSNNQTGSTTTASSNTSFSMAEIEGHSTPENCWTTINGSVYDLTTWISRHPGGPKPIQGLCGKDGTANFTRKHGNSSTAQAALALLKIGALQ